MSIRHLKDPKWAHDISDDLESVFWVLMYGALTRFLLPNQSPPLEMFDEVQVNHEGRCTGGTEKSAHVSSSYFNRFRYDSDTLRWVVRKICEDWSNFHVARFGTCGFEGHPELVKRMVEMLELAPKPCYWVERFTKVLDTYGPGIAAPRAICPAGFIQESMRDSLSGMCHLLLA